MTANLIKAVIATTLLTGCVIVTDRDDWDDSDDWRNRQETNREYIADLALGLSINDVRADLGSPDLSEAYREGNDNIVVLRYRTQHESSDGETTRDETTPLVFVNGELKGWGERAARDYY